MSVNVTESKLDIGEIALMSSIVLLLFLTTLKVGECIALRYDDYVKAA